MELILFTFFTIASIITAYFLHIYFLKQSIVNSFFKVAKSYDLRIEQKEKLSKIVDEYHNSLPIEAHTSLNTLGNSLLKVEEENLIEDNKLNE